MIKYLLYILILSILIKMKCLSIFVVRWENMILFFLKLKYLFSYFFHQNMHIYRILFCLKEKKEYFFKNIVIFLI